MGKRVIHLESSTMIVPVVLAFAIVGVVSSAPGKLPDSFPRCKKSDPNFDECLKNAIRVSYEKLVPGVSSLGVFPTDPLKITALDITQGTGPVSIDLKFRDLVIKGLKNVKITNVKSDLGNYKLDIEAELTETLKLDGDYEINGKVLVLPLVGKGKSHLTLDNVKAKVSIIGKESKKDGKIYMLVDKFNLDYSTTKLTVNFENLFSQDKTLGNNMNAFLNENWKDIHKEVQPAIREAFGAAFKEIASRVFAKVPFDDIFLP